MHNCGDRAPGKTVFTEAYRRDPTRRAGKYFLFGFTEQNQLRRYFLGRMQAKYQACHESIHAFKKVE